MAPAYKLVYFDTTGRGELIRWIFSLAGQEFEDVRIKKADWPALKATTPFGSLPYLEVDGKPLGQSIAIARFVARKNGLAGKDDFEAAQVDAIADYVDDALKPCRTFMHEQDEKKKAVLMEEFLKVGVQPYLKGFERHLQANNNGEGFFVGSKPTWADLGVTIFLDKVSEHDSNLLDNYKLLKAHSQRVHELKGIKEWLLKRPTN